MSGFPDNSKKMSGIPDYSKKKCPEFRTFVKTSRFEENLFSFLPQLGQIKKYRLVKSNILMINAVFSFRLACTFLILLFLIKISHLATGAKITSKSPRKN